MSGLVGTAAALLRQAAGMRLAAVSTARRAVDTLARSCPVLGSADLDDRDPDFIREHLSGLWLLAALYFRAEVRGLERLPAGGPVLLIGNHYAGGLAAPDIVTFTLAHNAFFGADRRFHPLAARQVSSVPYFGWLRKFGAVPPSLDTVEEALDIGAAVLACPDARQDAPDGAPRAGKGDLVGYREVLRLAMARDVLVAPVVSVRRGRNIAGGILANVPLPVKILIQVIEPFRIASRFGPNSDIDEVHEVIQAQMTSTRAGLATEWMLPMGESDAR